MCDYSLDFVASRPAKAGDQLVTTSFNSSLTRGFATVGEPKVAVCLFPGTEIAFEKEVECDSVFKALRKQKVGAKVARFRQVNTDQPSVHHDALEFPTGQIVPVTKLCEGQEATVLQLPAESRTAEQAKKQEFIASVT